MAAVVGKITSWFRFALSIAESRRSVSRVFLTSPGFVSTSPGVVPTSPGVVSTSPGVVSTSPGVVPTSPGLVLPNQGTRRNSRRVVKRTTRSVWPARRSESIMLKKPQSVWEVLFSRTYIYIRILLPGKSIHPFTRSAFPVDFHGFPV